MVVGGPLVGGLIYGLLEGVWVVFGLEDLRILLVAALVALGALLRFYAYLGWLD